MPSSSSSLLVPRDGGSFEFYSRQRLHRFLRISPPYDTCLAYAPSAKNAPHCSRPINRNKKQQVPNQFEDLYRAPVPSLRAAGILEDLSSNVVCGITGWHQNKASEVYREWCHDLWDAYLYANNLDARLWTRRTPLLSRVSWEEALDDAREEQQDSSSEEEYNSDEDNGGAYDDDFTSTETTPDTTTSSFDESPFHANGSERSYSSQASESTLVPESSVHSHHSSRNGFAVYRDREVSPAEPAVRPAYNLVQSGDVLGENRRVLRPLDPNIAVSNAGDRTPSEWSHESSNSASSSTAVSQPESRGSGSNSALQEARLNSRSSLGNGIPLSTVGTSSTSEETAVEGFPISERSRSSVGVSIDDEAPDTVVNSEVETGSWHENANEEADVSSQDGYSGNELPRVRASHSRFLDIRHADAPQDLTEEGSASLINPDPEAAVLVGAEDAQEDDVTSPLTLGSSFFDDAEEAIDIVTVSPGLVPSRPGFCRYPQARSSLAQLSQLWDVMTKPVKRTRRHSGFIYAFARDSLPGFLKIGYVKTADISQPQGFDPVNNRLARWYADCHHPISEVFRVAITCQAVEKIESLVHLTLRESRWVENPPCVPCYNKGRSRGRQGGGRHDEWFELDEQTASHVVNLWASFAARLPYDRWGRLVDFWSEKLEEQQRNVREGDSIRSWVDRLPRLLEDWTRRDLDSISPLGR